MSVHGWYPDEQAEEDRRRFWAVGPTGTDRLPTPQDARCDALSLLADNMALRRRSDALVLAIDETTAMVTAWRRLATALAFVIGVLLALLALAGYALALVR